MAEKSSYAPPFLAFASDSSDLETLKAFTARQQWPENSVLQGDIKTATEYLKTNTSPVLLLVEISSAAAASAELDALAEVCSPDTKVIVIGNVNEYSFYCWLTEIGITNYLLRPLSEATLDHALQKATAQPVAAAKQERPPGKIIAMIGTRGGVGTSTLALNLAGMIAELSKKNVALIDVDPHEGSIALMLDIEPAKGFREALEKPDRIDSLFIERVMAKPHKHLSILSSEEPMHELVHYHEQASEALLKELRGKYDIVILDLPRMLDDFTRSCLRMADNTILVTELTLLSLRDTLRSGDMMRDHYKMKQPVIVANRVGHTKFDMKQGDFEKGVNAKIDFLIPNAPEVFMQISSDIPSLKFKDHASVKPLYKLAELIEPSAKTLLAAVKEKKGLFSSKKKAASAEAPAEAPEETRGA